MTAVTMGHRYLSLHPHCITCLGTLCWLLRWCRLRDLNLAAAAVTLQPAFRVDSKCLPLPRHQPPPEGWSVWG